MSLPSLPEKYRPLVSWLRGQRAALKAYEEDPSQEGASTDAFESTMTEEQRERLLGLGFASHIISPEQLFQKRLGELQAFKAEHGRCLN
jgi:hypothetical protein